MTNVDLTNNIEDKFTLINNFVTSIYPDIKIAYGRSELTAHDLPKRIVYYIDRITKNENPIKDMRGECLTGLDVELIVQLWGTSLNNCFDLLSIFWSALLFTQVDVFSDSKFMDCFESDNDSFMTQNGYIMNARFLINHHLIVPNAIKTWLEKHPIYDFPPIRN